MDRNLITDRSYVDVDGTCGGGGVPGTAKSNNFLPGKHVRAVQRDLQPIWLEIECWLSVVIPLSTYLALQHP